MEFMFTTLPCLVGLVAYANGQKTTSYITYEQLKLTNGQILHIGKISIEQAQIKIAMPAPHTKLETTENIIKTTPAILAINGSFFNPNGNTSVSLKTNGKWIKSPSSIRRGVVGWYKDKKNKLHFVFDRLYKNKNKQIQSVYNKDKWWEKAQRLIGGYPLLIKDHKILDTSSERLASKFLNNQYARTAICKSKKHLFFVVAEGGDAFIRKWLYSSPGMSIEQLAIFLRDKLHCSDALNLDGGHSSALIYNKKRMNTPIFFLLPPRKIANAIIAY
jgi:exopolysaccharide biosynthesis protein